MVTSENVLVKTIIYWQQYNDICDRIPWSVYQRNKNINVSSLILVNKTVKRNNEARKYGTHLSLSKLFKWIWISFA